MSDPLLEARQLCKYFRPGTPAEVRAVDDVSLSVTPGSFTALTGHSGSGKTTLLALLGALERPSGGQVLFQGRSLRDYSDMELARLRRRMGFVFQNFSLIAHLPVWENITYPLIPRGIGRKERWRIAQDWLARLGLTDKTWSYSQELSGGEQQRVALARALAGRPEVILADEPVSNLDPASATTVLDLFREVHAAGTTVILSAHDPSVVALATTVIELHAGKIKTRD